MSIYIGNNNIAQSCPKLYIGVDGIARQVTKGYVGINGIARQFYQSGYVWEKYNVIYTESGWTTNSICNEAKSPIFKMTEGYTYTYVSSYKINNGKFVPNQTKSIYVTSLSFPFTFYFAPPVSWGYYNPKTGAVSITQATKTGFSSDTLYKLTAYELNSSYSGWVTAHNDASGNYPMRVNTLASSKGSYVENVSSDDPSAYPDDGIQDGYWYVKI